MYERKTPEPPACPNNAVLDNAPEVDFVRCGECRKRPKNVEWAMCHVLCRQTHKDDYCSYGERRTDV